MSKRKARDEDPPPRPVLYYPEDDTARPTQCVMPASPPIPHASSPARERPPSRRPSKTPLNRKRRSALDNIGYVPEDIPTPRVFPKTSLFASAHASGSTSKQPRTLSATFGKRRAASSDNEPTGAETEYVVDSSDQDGEVPARLKTKTKRKRMRKSYPTGLRIQPVPRPSLPIAKPTGFLPTAPSRTPQQAPQTSPARRGAVNRPALVRTSPATNASPYRARVVPIQSERRKRPEPVVMLERRSKPKRPRISGPSPTPASAPPEVIVLSSSDSEQEQEPEREKEREQRQEEQGREREMEREVSNSPSLGGRWSRGSSRSSDVVVVDSPGDGEIEEIPAPPSRQQSISSPERVSAEGEHTRPEEVEDATEKDGSPMHVDPTPTVTQTQPEEPTPELPQTSPESPQTSPEPPQTSLEPSQTSPDPPQISPEPTNSTRPLSQTASPPSYKLCPSGIPLFRPSTVASTLTSPRGLTPATLSARPTPTPAPREQSELGEFAVSPDQPRVEFGRPVLLFSKFDPPSALRDDSVLRDDGFESLSFKPSQDSEPAPEVAPVAPPVQETLLPSPTPVREPTPTDEATESPVQPSPESVPPTFEAPTPSTLTPAPEEPTPPPPKPRIRRMECVLLPRASKRTRAAMFPKAKGKGKGKSVEVLFEAGLLSRKVDKGKGVARGEKQGRWKVDSSSAGSGEGSEEYEDTEGSGQAEESEEAEAEETESEVDESAPGPSTKTKTKTKKPRQVKYIVMDSRAASPSNYEDLPDIVAQTPERYCHCCRTLSTKGKLKMRCSNIVTRIRRGQGLGPGQCATAWCQRCIAKHDIVFNPLLMDFTCPLCSNSCECDVCRRKRGQDPLGIGAYKVVKQKPGRRTLKNVVGGSPPVEDEEDSSPPENVPGPSAPKPRGPTTWHGRHTPPPLRRGRATGSHVRSTSLHIFIPRRPQVDESREVEATEPQEAQETESQGQAQPEVESREPSEGDPDVDVEGTESNSAIDDSFWFEEPEEDEDGQSTDREDKMRTFEGDYGADATLLGADSVPFELHHDVPEEGPRHEDELPDFTFPLESTRPSVEPDTRGYEGLLDGAEPEAEVQPEEPTETDDIEGEVQALSEAVLSLDQASPSFMQDNESVLEGLDANMTAAQIHFCGSESLELQPVPGAGPALDIGDPLGNDMDVLLDTIDLGQLHPEGTFETVPSITMADASSPASHESLRDIPLYDAATEAEPPEPAPPAPPLFIEHDFEVPLSGGPDFMRPRAHTTKSPSTTAPPPPSEGLLSPKTETDKGWSPEIEFSPIRDLAPFLRPQPDPDPTLDDPESAKSTILETPSPQLENYGDTITVAADLFEETNHSSREATVTTIDSRSDQKTSTEVASQASSESPVDSTSFALPSREQQVQVQDALRARFQAEAPPPDSQAESSESTKSAKEGKYLRSRRRYGMHE